MTEASNEFSLHCRGLTSLQAAISETLDTAQLSSYKAVGSAQDFGGNAAANTCLPLSEALSIHHLRALLAAHLASEGTLAWRLNGKWVEAEMARNNYNWEGTTAVVELRL